MVIFVSKVDIGHGAKPAGFYVQRSGGLFPAPLPQSSDDVDRVESLFHFMGTFLAKCIQDGRIVDMPFSRPFLKMLCMGEVLQGGFRPISFSTSS